MLSPAGIMAAAITTAASLGRRFAIKQRATLAKITNDAATMQAIGHKVCQVAAGTSCKTCHAENLISFAIRRVPESATRSEITASRSEEHTSELQSPYDLVC